MYSGFHYHSAYIIKQDPLMSECLIYQLKPGKTVVRAMEMTALSHTRTEDDSRLDEWTAKNPLRSDLVAIRSWKNIAILIMSMGKS